MKLSCLEGCEEAFGSAQPRSQSFQISARNSRAAPTLILRLAHLNRLENTPSKPPTFAVMKAVLLAAIAGLGLVVAADMKKEVRSEHELSKRGPTYPNPDHPGMRFAAL